MSEYQKCVTAKKCPPGALQSSHWAQTPDLLPGVLFDKMWAPLTANDHPIAGVNWDNAQAYVAWLKAKTGQNYRLPTEAEWERAARGGKEGQRFWWGDEFDMRFANTAAKGDGWDWTSPVDAYPGHPYGLFDMAGNLLEWVQDCWHDNYEGTPASEVAWTKSCFGTQKVLRGGSWGSDPDSVRSAARGHGEPNDRYFALGFRVARGL